MVAAARRAKEKPAKKAKAQRKTNPAQSPDNQENGLWVNWEFLRSLTKSAPQTIVHGITREEDNRYLQLADIALRPVERRKKKRDKRSTKSARPVPETDSSR
jgi:hypothetical protein